MSVFALAEAVRFTFPVVRVLVLCTAFFLLAMPARATAGSAHPVNEQGERTELWTGKVLSATFKAGICTRPNGAVRGVFWLRHANGDVDVYHVYGFRNGEEVEVRHPSGHIFRARVTPDGNLSGKVRIKNRIGLTMKGSSQRDVPLSDDCAPLR